MTLIENFDSNCPSAEPGTAEFAKLYFSGLFKYQWPGPSERPFKTQPYPFEFNERKLMAEFNGQP